MTHFSGPMLVVEVLGKNGKKQTILVKSKFEPLMVCIDYLIMFFTLIVSAFIFVEKKYSLSSTYYLRFKSLEQKRRDLNCEKMFDAKRMEETYVIAVLLLSDTKFWVYYRKYLPHGSINIYITPVISVVFDVRKFCRYFEESRQLKFRNSGNSDNVVFVILTLEI